MFRERGDCICNRWEYHSLSLDYEDLKDESIRILNPHLISGSSEELNVLNLEKEDKMKQILS